ncbi:ATP-dependent zinc metalloprotease YME1L1 [Holothuria leucospilota]|uniref:ATP-dependent zinc metalloprotease YME1L1 n=1 Tax=Holothuria leucospilota TaxID=206669 RepID=A0A9Q1C1J1_HOLLE|nr:ATP-dependent zinc metalloprotease YME1L1 [Holothuria leucospilota]
MPQIKDDKILKQKTSQGLYVKDLVNPVPLIIGHVPRGLAAIFRQFLDEKYFLTCVATGKPIPSFSPWPHPSEIGGGVVIPCKYKIYCEPNQIGDVISRVACCLGELGITRDVLKTFTQCEIFPNPHEDVQLWDWYHITKAVANSQSVLYITISGIPPQRGFKTKRSTTKNQLTSTRLREQDGFLSALFSWRHKEPPQQLADKVDHALSRSESLVSDQNSFKTGFLEGYLKGKDDPKKSERWKGWTTFFVIGILGYIYLKMMSVFSRVSIIGSSSVDTINVSDVSFSDVRGIDEPKRELEHVVNYLKDPEKYTSLGGKLPKGVLLVGSPGTGKTLLARAVAGEANVPFYYASGSDFDNMFVGSGAKRVRDVFAEAKLTTPCVIFIDELDSVGGKRVDSPLHPYARQTINQLLSEMDGFKQNEGIVVLAATNFAESLDAALTRPGRFDMTVTVPKPDARGRQQILDLYLGKIKVGPDVDVEVLARGTVGFTGADLQNLVNQAALEAARKEKSCVDMSDMEFAKDKILMGPERKSARIDEKNREITAYHEGGHALVSLLPEKDQWNETRAQLLAQMDICMGGRIAEELIFGTDYVTTGASSDFEQATNIARFMLGVMTYREDNEFPRGEAGKPSPETQSLIEDEIRRLLKESYERAKMILKAHSKEHHKLAKALLDYETLSADEVAAVIKGEEVKR